MTIERKKKYIAGIILIVTTLLYSYTYFNTFPVSEGWGIMYAEQIFQGKVPYRDFYYYLPPLNLLIDSIFWKLSFGYLIVYRFFWLCQRIVMQLLIFNLLNKFFSLKSSFLACFFAVFLCTANTYDLLGDYNQTTAFLTVILACFTTAFATAENEKIRYRKLFSAGIVLGLMFLTKQTIFLATAIIHVILLTYICIRRKEKNYWNYCLSVIIGAAIPILIAVVAMLLTGSFFPFIEEVFLNVDGKGSILDIVTAGPIAMLKQYSNIAVACSGILCTLYISEYHAALDGKRKQIYDAFAIITVALVLIGNSSDNIKETLKIFLTTKSGIVLLVLAIVPVIIFSLKKNESLKKISGIYAIVCMLLGTAFLETINQMVYRWTGLFAFISATFLPIMLWIIVLLMINRMLFASSNDDALHIFFMGAALSGIYATMMASGVSNISYHGVFLLLPLTCCYILNLPSEKKIIKIGRVGFVSILLVLSMACVAEKMNCGYSWWGTVDEPLNVKTEMSDIKALEGVKLSEHQKELYDTITRLIKENSTKEDTIWTYPHMRLFNVLADNYTLDTFMPVVFYDVSSDFYIEQETKLLKENLPDIIIWEDIENCKEVHEQAFREGKPLKQREMEKMFQKKFGNEYTLIGVMDNFRVYKLNNEKPIQYTYGV